MVSLKIVPYPKTAESAVRRFNQRLAAGGLEKFAFPEAFQSLDLPRIGERQIWREYFVAIDSTQEVRGGYVLRGQPFWSEGRPTSLTFLKLPVSEGVIDRRYAAVGVTLLQDVTSRDPFVFALGMGGIHMPLPKILNRMKWRVSEVPFFFKIRRFSRVLNELRMPNQTVLGRFALELAARSGCGSLACLALQRSSRPYTGWTVEEVSDFGDWVDEIWAAANSDYGLIGERTSRTLPILYQSFSGRIRVIRVSHEGRPAGWAATLVTELNDHSQFGNLKVATLVDGLAKAGEVSGFLSAVTAYLESHDPDLIVTNQTNDAWLDGLKSQRFFRGPSNFALAISPQAAGRLAVPQKMHFNRGDGDGPINL